MLPAQNARVVLNEKEGIIVIGHDVRISTVAVAHGNLTIKVKEEFEVSQPTAPLFLGGSGDTTLIAGASTGDVSSQISGGSPNAPAGNAPGNPPAPGGTGGGTQGQALIRKLIVT